jgi:hypothetical protein
MPLPHDFRAQARQPIPVNGKGAPLQISGSKLQENFEYLDKKEVGGGLPDGKAGDMLYHDGNNWVRLTAPASGVFVLSHNGTVPSWIATEECS